jgi:IclR helix-turn-helix domain
MPKPAIAKPAADGDPPRTPIVIELDRAQVDQVVRAVSDGGAISVLLSGLGEFRERWSRALQGGPSPLDDRRLSRSLLAGLLVLASLPADRSYRGIVELGRDLEMSASNIHRYLTTLVVVGLVERDATTRKYRLASNASGI